MAPNDHGLWTLSLFTPSMVRMMSRITGKSVRDEVRDGTRSFDLIRWIRRRAQYLSGPHSSHVLLPHAIRRYNTWHQGDLLIMDALRLIAFMSGASADGNGQGQVTLCGGECLTVVTSGVGRRLHVYYLSALKWCSQVCWQLSCWRYELYARSMVARAVNPTSTQLLQNHKKIKTNVIG